MLVKLPLMYMRERKEINNGRHCVWNEEVYFQTFRY